MQYENFLTAKQIVLNIDSLQKDLDDLNSTYEVRLYSGNGYLNSINVDKDDRGGLLNEFHFLAAKYVQELKECIEEKIKNLKKELESL